MYDVIIIGAGPAGTSASLYTKRANLNTLILYSKNTSKKLITEKEIEFNNDISFGIYEK